ncbi:MAG TPA: ribose-phosphate pyrophosphokinase [Firmicutes bacterium]|jgi:ribose-phosphate pyrophosphokinase|nr:ribose-phosphate pyrophosphokinase [Bacillota bacterium]
MDGKKVKIFTGTANPTLAYEIAEHLGLDMGRAVVNRFRDGEINLRIDETVRGCEVFVIQPTCAPADSNLMELLVMIDAFKRASAKHIAAVVPYYGYARQDRKNKPRDPICAKLVANLLEAAGADRVLTMDLHAGQIQGFFDIPVDNLRGMPILAQYFHDKQLDNVVVVSPDVGGVTRARQISERLHAPLAIIDKRRPEQNVSEVMHVIGNVRDATCIMVDDIIDTGGTIVNGAEALMREGAKAVYACCSHPVFSHPAAERLENSSLAEVVATNTIPVPPEKRISKLKILSVAPLFGEAIRRIVDEVSVSYLFD